MRGLRAATDFEYELQIAHANADLEPEVDTVFLPTRTKNGFISASLVREIASHGGDVSRYAPGVVCEALGDEVRRAEPRHGVAPPQAPPSHRRPPRRLRLRHPQAGRASSRASGVVLGSGLGAFADTLDDLVKIPYRDLPHMPASAVAGHAGNLCFGDVGGVRRSCACRAACTSTRGTGRTRSSTGVRTMARLGVRCVLLTNAAGGLEPSWSAGDLMVVTDHLNLTGTLAARSARTTTRSARASPT